MRYRAAVLHWVLIVAAAGTATVPAFAQVGARQPTPPPAPVIVVKSSYSFDVLIDRLEHAVSANGMGIVARASASAGAAARGVKIPGNLVLMVFRNDYAVRMLAANVSAGIEAPLRIYVTESAAGVTSVSYRSASTVFSPYRTPALDTLAGELDLILEQIVREATKD